MALWHLCEKVPKSKVHGTCPIYARSRQSEMTLGNIVHKRQKSAGDDQSTLTSKRMGRVIRSPKQRYQWRHKMDLGPTKIGPYGPELFWHFGT